MDEEKSINDIPPEILERILSYLNDPKDLFNCRLVQNLWKKLIGPLLEEKLHAITTKWNLTEFNSSEPLIPSLWLKYDVYQSQGPHCQQLFCPKSILHHRGNPFPSNSLHLGVTLNEGRSFYAHGRQIENVHSFFGKFGHHLTCLVLDGYSTSPLTFAKLLSKVPFLKSLSLPGLFLKVPKGEIFYKKNCVLPSLPQLTHLRLIEYGRSIVNDKLTIKFVLWILESYSKQLVGLSVEGVIFAFEEQQNLKAFKTECKFGKLKELKINPINKCFLNLLNGADLTHIMVTRENICNITTEEMLNSIENFSKSLIYLRLPTLLTNFEEKSSVKFTSLKSLSINNPSDQNLVSVMKMCVLPKFVALEKLEFICNGKCKSKIARGMQKAEYWMVCPTLQQVSAYIDLEENCSCIKNDGKSRVVWRANSSC
ncbi:unnamed protein product [Orchesella dallaii]|uniref:F-box domain-containing protein n=1 Tax=Orchesella dallaii TaxID=48710 RepID=A0ABP1S4E9_9HEXA